VSSATTESNCSYHLELQDIESKEKEREREDQLEDASLAPTSKHSHSPLLRKDKRISKD
jgi:ABC-type proline/glycine betaine transport system ATPase subunit